MSNLLYYFVVAYQHHCKKKVPRFCPALHDNFLSKRTRGWLALRGLWGKKKKRGAEVEPLEGKEEDLEEEEEEEAREKKLIPKISQEELEAMMAGGGAITDL